ncbi:MAG TPA: beta-L-arabinofuranosidase domain-containing protein [Microbacteriaceae bacterium]|nr:beta-L-arabinofuranosidase domain-containing protein [Microbacteriaceae bacterium]
MSSTSLGGPVEPSHAVLRPLGVGEIIVTGGLWHRLQSVNAEATLGHCLAWMERIGWIGNFDRAAAGTIGGDHAGIEFVDSEVYKLLEAMAWELGRKPDGRLEQEYDSLVGRVAAAQQADGYLHTSFGRAGQPERYSNLEFGHELYCFGHLFQAAVARLRTGHDDLLPQVARRLADHVCAAFGPDGRPAIGGHAEVEMGLVELARATGERRYLRQAQIFIDRRGHDTLRHGAFGPFGAEYFQDEMPVREARTMRGHAVRALYLASGAADVACETGDKELAEAVKAQWQGGMTRRTYITGGVGSHHQDEGYGDDFELPPDRAYSETCAGIASVMLSWRLLLATGDEEYADLIERTLLNNVLASPREDGKAFFYANTLHQRRPGTVPDEHALAHRAEASLRAPWFEVSCCPTNVARTLASVGLYFATATDAGIQIHQYGCYQIATTLASGPVRVQVETDYPFDESVKITVLEAPAADTTLSLRIPPWAGDTMRLSEPATRPTPGAAVIRRRFLAGDVIELVLSVRPRVTRPDRRIDAVRGTFAVEAGPLVMALESADLPAGWSVNDIEADPLSLAGSPDGPTLDVTRCDTGDGWPYRSEAQHDTGEKRTARLIPYSTWANRGPSTMRVWIPEPAAGL